MAKKIYTVTETKEVEPMVQFLDFDRYNLEAVTRIDAKGKGWTQIECIRESLEKYGYYNGRTDIAMINLWQGQYDKLLDQHCIYPNGDGDIDFGQAGDWMTDEQKERCREISRLCLAAEREYDLPTGTIS